MVKSKIELLFSLSNAAKEDSILVRFQPRLSLIQELDRNVDIRMLTRCQDSQLGVFDRIQLVGESLDQGVIQSEQVKVLTLIKRLVFKVAD